MKIKVEPYLMKKGNRVAKGAIEFADNEGILANFHLIGFTICDDKEKGLFVLFPSSIVKNKKDESSKPYFFLRPKSESDLERLETAILDVYESMTAVNKPVLK